MSALTALPNVFTALGRTFDFVLIDGLRDFGDRALTTMDEADEIILVINDDVPALRCGLRAIDLFRRLGYPAERLRLLINKSTDDDATFLQTVESAYGRSIDWRVPPIDGVAQCQTDGRCCRSRIRLPLVRSSLKISRGHWQGSLRYSLRRVGF